MNSIVWSHWGICGLYEQDSYRKKKTGIIIEQNLNRFHMVQMKRRKPDSSNIGI